MNTKVIYDIFLTSAKNHCTDLAVQALPMLLHDARTGERKYTDEQTDLEQLHRDYESIAAQDKALQGPGGRLPAGGPGGLRRRGRPVRGGGPGGGGTCTVPIRQGG